MTNSSSAISVRNLWQVFGPNPERIIGSPDAALPRAELRAKTGNTAAVRDVSFDVAPGEVFVVMGLSGSGKSTLVRCLTRLIEPTSGHVVMDGEDILAASPSRLRELRRTKFSMVFQNFGLLPHRRVLDNIGFALEINGVSKAARHARAQEVVELVGLTGFDQAFPEQLSGGMQQRVGLARALAVDPEVMFLDEPFSALDPLIRRDMQTEVIRLHQDLNKTMIFITHDLDEALRVGDRIANPADDYVADFTRDIPKSHVLTVRTIARPLRSDEHASDRTVQATTIIRDATAAVVDAPGPVTVVDGGHSIGVITPTDILRVVGAGAQG